MKRNSAIVQAGFAQSGNIWLWHIIERALAEARIPRKSFLRSQPIYPICKNWELSFKGQGQIDYVQFTRSSPFYAVPPVFSWPIDDFEDYVRKCTHVWTQGDPVGLHERYFRCFSKIVYIVRDPRDISLSMQKIGDTPFAQTFFDAEPNQPPAIARGWNENVSNFLAARETLPVHFVFYERLLASWESELGKLLEFLGIKLGARALKNVEKRAGFREMRKRYPIHLAWDEAYSWSKELDSEKQRAFTDFHLPLLQRLGYPIRAEEARGVLPGT